MSKLMDCPGKKLEQFKENLEATLPNIFHVVWSLLSHHSRVLNCLSKLAMILRR